MNAHAIKCLFACVTFNKKALNESLQINEQLLMINDTDIY